MAANYQHLGEVLCSAWLNPLVIRKVVPQVTNSDDRGIYLKLKPRLHWYRITRILHSVIQRST